MMSSLAVEHDTSKIFVQRSWITASLPRVSFLYKNKQKKNSNNKLLEGIKKGTLVFKFVIRWNKEDF